jgi:hypothetical protein
MRRRVVVLAVGCVGLLVLAGISLAGLVTASSGSLTLQSDAGDFVGQGQTASFSSPADTFLVNGNGNAMRVDVHPADYPNEFWQLELAAPAGQQLTPGTYANARRWPFQATSEPGLSVFGDGRGCNTLTGSFTVLSASYGPYGYPVNFDATFEQHCEGFAPALRGEVRVSNPNPPPLLQVQLSVDGNGSRSGAAAVVHGTVTCNRSGVAPVQVTVSQPGKKSTVSGSSGVSLNCSTSPASWTVTVTPAAGSFGKGTVAVQAKTSVVDSFYSNYTDNNPVVTTSASASGSVRLR